MKQMNILHISFTKVTIITKYLLLRRNKQPKGDAWTYLYQITTTTMLEKNKQFHVCKYINQFIKRTITQNTTTFGLLKVDNWTNEIKTDYLIDETIKKARKTPWKGKVSLSAATKFRNQNRSVQTTNPRSSIRNPSIFHHSRLAYKEGR